MSEDTNTPKVGALRDKNSGTIDHTAGPPTPSPATSHHGADIEPGPLASRVGHAYTLGLVGAILGLIAPLLSWCVMPGALGDLSLYFNPSPIQMLAMVFAAFAGYMAVRGKITKGQKQYADNGTGLYATGIGMLAISILVIFGIASETQAIANADPGLWLYLVAGCLVLVGGLARPASTLSSDPFPTNKIVGAVIMTILIAIALFVAAAMLNQTDPWVFIIMVVAVGFFAWAMYKSLYGNWLVVLGGQQRRPLMLATFVAAFAFPLTQNGNDTNMSVAVTVLAFAATAIGLNIVVGLAGLLDLGYIAFLGAGAYVAAMMSHSAYATLNIHPPFWVVVLTGATVSAIFGLIIGSPTLRVSGDYLAIVTLAFGEIFRLAMFNLNGTNGPNLTNGPDGIASIPDLNFFGFDFGKSHNFFGFEITRYANYYFLLLIVMAFIIMVFMRLNHSRIGRGWVAIREDEKAAEAMGVNVFGLKLLAFAGGAALAGMAGTIKAHVDVSVTPDQYDFLESAFLLAAVVLGGMGTVVGVVIGAVLLKLVPEKLRFFSEYRLLLFGLLLVIMMRLRPEGLIKVHRSHPTDDLPKGYKPKDISDNPTEILGGKA